MSGVPSLLGLPGGLVNGDAGDLPPPDLLVLFELGGDMADLEVSQLLFGGASSSPWSLRKLCDDFRGGGLGGGGGSRLVDFFSFMLLSASRTVEFDEEEVSDSLTAARP